MELTIFEIHLDGSTFNAPFAGDDAAEAGDDGDDTRETAAADASGADLRPVLVVAVLLGLAMLARYLRSGGEETEADEDGAPVDEIEVGGS